MRARNCASANNPNAISVEGKIRRKIYRLCLLGEISLFQQFQFDHRYLFWIRKTGTKFTFACAMSVNSDMILVVQQKTICARKLAFVQPDPMALSRNR